MINVTKDDIETLQSNLKTFRLAMGLSGKELGSILGVTRQNIWQYENYKVKMNVAYYIAIRVIINDHIKNHPDNRELIVLNNALLNKEEFTYEKRNNV